MTRKLRSQNPTGVVSAGRVSQAPTTRCRRLRGILRPRVDVHGFLDRRLEARPRCEYPDSASQLIPVDNKSPVILILPFIEPISSSLTLTLMGSTLAMGRPRFVTMMPPGSRRSSRLRHFALNSVALIVLSLIMVLLWQVTS